MSNCKEELHELKKQNDSLRQHLGFFQARARQEGWRAIEVESNFEGTKKSLQTRHYIVSDKAERITALEQKLTGLQTLYNELEMDYLDCTDKVEPT